MYEYGRVTEMGADWFGFWLECGPLDLFMVKVTMLVEQMIMALLNIFMT